MYKQKETLQARVPGRVRQQTSYKLTPLLNGKIQYTKKL